MSAVTSLMNASGPPTLLARQSSYLVNSLFGGGVAKRERERAREREKFNDNQR